MMAGKIPTLFPSSMAIDPVNLKKCWVIFSLSVSFPTSPAEFSSRRIYSFLTVFLLDICKIYLPTPHLSVFDFKL